MTPSSKRYDPAYAHSLIKIAEGDLKSAMVLAAAKEGRPENICFIAQQTVEKAIKAVLCHLGQNVPLTHDLAALLSVLPNDIVQPNSGGAAEGLSEYATVRRYEEGFVKLTTAEISAALKLAEIFLNWAKAILRKS